MMSTTAVCGSSTVAGVKRECGDGEAEERDGEADPQRPDPAALHRAALAVVRVRALVAISLQSRRETFLEPGGDLGLGKGDLQVDAMPHGVGLNLGDTEVDARNEPCSYPSSTAGFSNMSTARSRSSRITLAR